MSSAFYGRYDLLNELKAYKVRLASNELPHKFETGPQNHDGIAGVLGALEYLEWLGKQFGADQAPAGKEAGFTGRRLELKIGVPVVGEYESELSRALIGIIQAVPGTHTHCVLYFGR